MAKKLFLISFIALCFVLSGTLVWGWEFDNVKEVNATDLKIINSFNLPLIGTDLIKIKKVFNTDHCLQECYTIWNVTSYIDSENFLSRLEFVNQYGTSKDIPYKVEYLAGYITKTWNANVQDCTKNYTIGKDEFCSLIVKEVEYQEEDWRLLTDTKLSGNYLIKITGYKGKTENIDYIPTILGVRVPEWDWWQGTPTHYWPLNQSSGTAYDDMGVCNLTKTAGISDYQAGKLGNAIYTNGVTNALNGASGFTALGAGSYTVAFWFKTNQSGSGVLDMLGQGTSGTEWVINIYNSGLRIDKSGADILCYPACSPGGTGIATDKWIRAVWTRNGTTNQRLYINGTNVANYSGSENWGATNFIIGIDNTFFGYIDDVQVYVGTAWNVGEVLYDYNNGTGRNAYADPAPPGADTTPPIVYLGGVNATTTSSASWSFNATATDNINVSLMSFTIWNSTSYALINQTNTSTSGNVSVNTTFTFPRQGTFIWNYRAYDNATNAAWNNTNWTITYFIPDTTPPQINLTYPNGTISYYSAGTNLSLNWSVNDSSATTCGYYLQEDMINKIPTNHSGDGTINYGEQFSADGNYATLAAAVNGAGYAYLEHNFTITKNLLSVIPMYVKSTYLIDSPPQDEVLGYYWNYTASAWQNLGLVQVDTGAIINDTNVIPPDGYTQPLVRIRYRMVDTFGAGTSAGVYETYLNYTQMTNVTCSANLASFNPSSSTKLWFYAEDTSGNNATATTNWSYTVLENSVTYNSSTLETSPETFIINFTYNSSYYTTASANLIYNGTSYAGTALATGVYRASVEAPLVWTSGVNMSHYWNITLAGGTTLNTRSTLRNQTVSMINLSKCDSGTYTLNFTVYDENNLTKINPFTFDSTFNYWIGSGTTYRTLSFSNASATEIKLCISPIQSTLKTDATINFDAAAYNPQYYYLSDQVINNITTNVSLYLLSGTAFIIKVQDITYLPVSGAIVQVQRFNAGTNNYTTVQTVMTDDNGKTVAFYVTETVDYRHIISKDGVILLITSKGKIVPETAPYTLTFTVGSPLEVPWIDFNDLSGLTTNLTYNNNTKTVTYSYVDTNANFSYGRLLVKLINYGGEDTIICNTTSALATASLTCNLATYNGTISAYGFITRGTDEKLVAIITEILDELADVFGKEGLFLAWFIIITAALTGLWSPTVGIIMTDLAIIFVNIIGFATFSPLFYFGILAISAILVVVLRA